VEELALLSRGGRCLYGLLISYLLLASCATQMNIPTVSDDPLERMVRDEAAQIVAVSEDRDRFAEYQIHLSNFPRKDILGMSVGNRRIYISYELAVLAYKRQSYLWLLRQTLAHEIAHETGHHALQGGATNLNQGTLTGGISSVDIGLPWSVRLRNYPADKELEADSKGLGYWQKLGWDCHIWVGILQNFEKQNYAGDIFHPTDKRLQQAQSLCPAQDKDGVL
jgi:predicted Zn-dependent protease